MPTPKRDPQNTNNSETGSLDGSEQSVLLSSSFHSETLPPTIRLEDNRGNEIRYSFEEPNSTSSTLNKIEASATTIFPPKIFSKTEHLSKNFSESTLIENTKNNKANKQFASHNLYKRNLTLPPPSPRINHVNLGTDNNIDKCATEVGGKSGVKFASVRTLSDRLASWTTKHVLRSKR